jgi:hypothetical protein
VATGKPKDFFRTHPDPGYRRRTQIYTHKPEGVIDEQHYILAPAMHGRIPEARPCTLTTVVYRDGSPRLWPLMFPKDGERDNEAWTSARAAAKLGIEKWVKLVWLRRSYQTRDALEGYAPDPDFTKLPPFVELVNRPQHCASNLSRTIRYAEGSGGRRWRRSLTGGSYLSGKSGLSTPSSIPERA